MTAIRTYLLTIVAGTILIAFTLGLVQEGPQKKLLSFVGGLMLVLIVLSPVLQIKERHLASVLSQIRLDAEELRAGVEIQNRDIQAMIISEQCASYISDKARELGAELTVRIQMSDYGTVPYPTGVVLTGSYTQTNQARLIEMIEKEFAIPEDCQIWSKE